MKYYKRIILTDTKMVICEVKEIGTDRRVHLSFHDSIFNSTEKSFQKAHKKADEIIALCEKYEYNSSK